MSSRYVENPGWTIRVLKTPQARALIKGVATATLASITANTPIRTGEYQIYWEDTTKVRSLRSAGGAAAQITTSDAIWHIIEYGSVNNPPYAPIRRGVIEMGLHWEGR